MHCKKCGKKIIGLKCDTCEQKKEMHQKEWVLFSRYCQIFPSPHGSTGPTQKNTAQATLEKTLKECGWTVGALAAPGAEIEAAESS